MSKKAFGVQEFGKRTVLDAEIGGATKPGARLMSYNKVVKATDM